MTRTDPFDEGGANFGQLKCICYFYIPTEFTKQTAKENNEEKKGQLR
jgi:hypothetical protein